MLLRMHELLYFNKEQSNEPENDIHSKDPNSKQLNAFS